jgi:hypothetical protein
MPKLSVLSYRLDQGNEKKKASQLSSPRDGLDKLHQQQMS